METVTDSGASNMRVNVSTTLDFISHNTTRDTTQVYAVNQLDRISEFQTRGTRLFFSKLLSLCLDVPLAGLSVKFAQIKQSLYWTASVNHYKNHLELSNGACSEDVFETCFNVHLSIRFVFGEPYYC